MARADAAWLVGRARPLGLAARAGELGGLAASTMACRRHDANEEAKRGTAHGELAGTRWEWEDAMELTCMAARVDVDLAAQRAAPGRRGRATRC